MPSAYPGGENISKNSGSSPSRAQVVARRHHHVLVEDGPEVWNPRLLTPLGRVVRPPRVVDVGDLRHGRDVELRVKDGMIHR